MAILIICVLGCSASLLLKKWTTNKWKRASWGAGIACIIWLAGFYTLMWFTDRENGMGPPLMRQMVPTYFIAFLSAISVIWSSEKIKNDSDGQD